MYKKSIHNRLTDIGKRSLASLIALCMLFSFAPAVIAEGIELTEEIITDIIPEVTETETAEEVTALSEIAEMRDEFSKTFLMSDGTYTQVSYASPVHYEDEDGVFQEIDNRLSVNAMTGKVTTGYGGTDVAFSQSQPQVSIEANGHNISWSVEKKNEIRNDDNVSLMNITPSYAPFTTNVVNVADTQDFKALPAEEQLMSAHKAFSVMKYASLAEGYAVNYTVAPGKVKEDILITSAENNEFVITVNAMGLTAVLGDYRTVIFKNNANETVLTFDVPYMYDANDEFSTDIDITLTPILGGYEITLTADEEWLNDEARAYPVVIDPIYIYGDHENESNIIDTMVHDDESTEDCLCEVDHDTSGIITTNLKNGKRYYSFFKFIFPDTLAAGKINSASVNLHLTSTTNSGGPFKLCRVLEDWDQSTITYDDMPSCDKKNPIANNVSYVVTGTEVTAEFNITQWARDFTAGILPNYGFMLAYADETVNDYNRFHTVDYTEKISWRPQFEVNYSTYWPGSGETHYINNYGSHKFLQAEQENSLYVANTEIYDTEETNTGLNWTVTPLDNYVSYFGISWGSHHLYDAGTYIDLRNATPPSEPTISNVPHDYQWHIFEYTDGSKTYQVIKNRETGRLLSVSGSTIVGVSANTGEYQQWYVGYEPCTSIEIENRVAVAGEVIEFDDLGVNYNGSGADPSLADDYSFCDATVSPSTAATVDDNKITISPNFTSGQITVTFERADTNATVEFNIHYLDYTQEFFIRNIGSRKYLDIESELNNAKAIQQSFEGNDTQKWLFERQSDGYFTIKNVKTARYLKVSGDLPDENQVVKVYESTAISAGYRFRIVPTSEGRIKIVPKTNPELTLAISGMNTSEGTVIRQVSYTNDSNYCDEWEFLSGKRTVNLQIQYDGSYVDRYPNAEQRIKNHLVVVQEKYLIEFDVWINYGEPTEFRSYADECGGDYDDPCDHSLDKMCANSVINDDGSVALAENHHTNIYNIAARIEQPNMQETLKMIFIGKDCCYIKGMNLACQEYTVLGLTYNDLGFSIIKNYSENQNDVTKTVLHEFNHFYYVEDHYGGTKKTTAQMNEAVEGSPYSSFCIHGENKRSESVLAEMTICEGCKATIRSNIDRFNHT